MVLRDLGLEKSSPVVTPVAKRPKSEELLLPARAKPLNAEDTTLYMSVTVRVNYLSFAAGSLARGMKKVPLEEVKRVGRYLRGGDQLEQSCFNHKPCLELQRCSATQPRWRLGAPKSRSGMAVMWGTHLIKHVSAVQSTIALSNGESEHNALLRSSAHAFVIKAMLNDWHYEVKCEIHMRCDSSAARGMSARQGLGTTRHVDVRFLWLQQAVQEGRVKGGQCPTSDNLSDTCTKSLSQANADRCPRCMNFLLGSVGSGQHRKLENTRISRM